MVVAPPARLGDRLVARWLHESFDRRLAGGVAPESDRVLAVRARMLTRPSEGAVLASALERVVRDARIGHRSLAAGIPTRRRAVLAAVDVLDALADRLLAPGPVSAHGVAQARILLTDGSGPLYHHGADEELHVAAARARAHLDLPLDPGAPIRVSASPGRLDAAW